MAGASRPRDRPELPAPQEAEAWVWSAGPSWGLGWLFLAGRWAASWCLYFGVRASAYAFREDVSSPSMTRSLHRTVAAGLSTAVSPRFLGSERNHPLLLFEFSTGLWLGLGVWGKSQQMNSSSHWVPQGADWALPPGPPTASLGATSSPSAPPSSAVTDEEKQMPSVFQVLDAPSWLTFPQPSGVVASLLPPLAGGQVRSHGGAPGGLTATQATCRVLRGFLESIEPCPLTTATCPACCMGHGGFTQLPGRWGFRKRGHRRSS